MPVTRRLCPRKVHQLAQWSPLHKENVRREAPQLNQPLELTIYVQQRERITACWNVHTVKRKNHCLLNCNTKKWRIENILKPIMDEWGNWNFAGVIFVLHFHIVYMESSLLGPITILYFSSALFIYFRQMTLAWDCDWIFYYHGASACAFHLFSHAASASSNFLHSYRGKTRTNWLDLKNCFHPHCSSLSYSTVTIVWKQCHAGTPPMATTKEVRR